MNCSDPSVYLLVLYIDEERELRIGGAGEYHLEAGTYVYAGSAKSGLGPRAGRHLGSPDRKRWHIDYVTPLSVHRAVFRKDHSATGECDASRELNRLYDPVAGVGASDCRCSTHLYYTGPGRRWV